jgi:hypothetical protein
MDPSFIEAVRFGAAAARSRLALERARRDPAELAPDARGRFAELALSVREGAAPWALLPTRVRRAINGGGTSADRGVDAVGLAGELYQMKWYREGRRVGHDAVARLNNIADAWRRTGGADARRIFVLRRGSELARGIPGADLIEVRHYDDADIFAVPLVTTEEPPVARAEPHDPIRAFTDLQDEVVAKLWGLYGQGRAVLSVELPPGAGKSYVIERLARLHCDEWVDNGESPVALVVAPRAEIVRQLTDLFEGRDWDVRAVVDGSAWPRARLLERPPDVIVITGQSAHKIPQGLRVAAVFYDEAHTEHGRAIVEDRVARAATYRLSATLGGPVDFRLSSAEAVRRGLTCDARFVFAAFPEEPTLADLAAHLAAHPEHSSVLACFQSQESARDFAATVELLGAGPAMSYVSADGESDALDRFRAGLVRVLCAVTRVEMGVNVHCCDTILLAEPWGSLPRLRQLCGRAARLHPTKPGFYWVLCGVGADAGDESRGVARLVDTFHAELPELCPPDAADLLDRIEVVPGCATAPPEAGDLPDEALDPVEAVRRAVYDSFGRRFADPLEGLRLEFARECAELAGRGISNFAGLERLRIELPALELSADPAEKFAPLFSAGARTRFPWDTYFGRRVHALPTAAISALLREEIRKGLEEGSLGPDSVRSPGANLYAFLAEKCRALPRAPLSPGQSYAELFEGCLDEA